MLQHQADVAMDALGRRLADGGAEMEVVDVQREPVPDLDRWSALVVLGGEANVWEEDEHPWLVDEKAALRAWMAGPVRPFLGICLGHQLLADALGGEVGRRTVAEAGVHTVTLSDAGADDPMLGLLGAGFVALQWHGAEVLRVPAGADVLAGNDRCAVQAMRVGPAAWGLQFHPEVGPSMAREWGRHPVFCDLLDADDGPGAAGRYPAALEANLGALTTVTARLAEVLMEQIDAWSRHRQA